MFKFLSAKTNRISLGVDFTPTGVAVVTVQTTGKMAGGILHSEFLPSTGANEQAEALKRWVEKKNLKKTPCYIPIASHDVQMLQLEKPSVPDEEMAAAVMWKVKDHISFDISKAVIETFQMPPSPKSPVIFINAVVVNESVVQNYVDLVRYAGLDLQVIDIRELVGRNYQRFASKEKQSCAMLQFGDHDGLLTIYHGPEIHVFRDFKTGRAEIDAVDEEAESLFDNMLLELQRSMDYFESTYGLGMAGRLNIFPRTAGTEKMASYLQNYVGYELDFIDVVDEADTNLDVHCFPAFCSSLRGVPA